MKDKARSERPWTAGLNKNALFKVLSLVFGGFAVTSLGWFGDLLKEGGGAVAVLPDLGWIFEAIFSFILFMSFSGAAYRLGSSFIPLRHLSRGCKPKPHQVLIMPLSRLPDDNEKNQDASKALEVTMGCGTLQDALKELEKRKLERWNGENFLRALHQHQPELKRLVLIYSASLSEEKLAQDQANYDRIARHFFPDIIISTDTTDFEDISALYDLMTERIDQIIASKFKPRDIMLDCTGGFKATSIAAALATLHYPEIEVQYVRTDTREVLAYNMQTHPNTRSN